MPCLFEDHPKLFRPERRLFCEELPLFEVSRACNNLHFVILRRAPACLELLATGLKIHAKGSEGTDR